MYYGIDALQTFCQCGFVGEIAASEPYPARKDGTLLPGGEVVKHDDVVGDHDAWTFGSPPTTTDAT